MDGAEVVLVAALISVRPCSPEVATGSRAARVGASVLPVPVRTLGQFVLDQPRDRDVAVVAQPPRDTGTATPRWSLTTCSASARVDLAAVRLRVLPHAAQHGLA